MEVEGIPRWSILPSEDGFEGGINFEPTANSECNADDLRFLNYSSEHKKVKGDGTEADTV